MRPGLQKSSVVIENLEALFNRQLRPQPPEHSGTIEKDKRTCYCRNCKLTTILKHNILSQKRRVLKAITTFHTDL